MDLNPSDHQVQLIEAFAALYSREAPTELVRTAEPLGYRPELWDRLQEVGVVMMAVDDAAGGWNASLLDLALVAEQHGLFIAPAPVIETQVAARLLARLDCSTAHKVLPSVLAGEHMVTLAVRPAHNRTAGLVPAGAIAQDVIVKAGPRLLLVPAEPNRRLVNNLGSCPLADVTVNEDAVDLGDTPAAARAYETAVTEWMALTANALVGIAARALELGVRYAKERKAFGTAIGAFQAVAHPLADAATNIDGARLLARRSAWAAEHEPQRLAELAAMAFAFATETARDVTRDCMQFHGGNGFTVEYDIQLYFRRARTWGAVFADARTAYRKVAAERYGDGRS